jgi:glutamyl-Q tRNA(Asp) synthetase
VARAIRKRRSPGYATRVLSLNRFCIVIVTRFAPSPTGYLHMGHAYAAAIAWQQARQNGGRFLVRIEDIDLSRCRAECGAAILDDLRWLGLAWDGPVRVQSEHLDDYRRVLAQLSARDLLYPCFCTRADIAREVAQSTSAPHIPHGPDGALLYPGLCRGLSPDIRAARRERGEPYALRLDMTRALEAVGQTLTYEEEKNGTMICRPDRFGDVVLARKDAPASYHICVTHDDFSQGVTLVTRSLDLQPATDVHRLLQALMGWPAPRYAHHAALTDAAGRRLAKRDGATSLRALREAGTTADAIRRTIGLVP